MSAEKRSKRRTALLVAGMVAAAITFIMLSRSDQPPVTRSEDASAAPHATSTAVEGAVDRSSSSTAERTAVASHAPEPRTSESPAIVLEVRDSAARLVAGVRVSVRDNKEKEVLSQETPDGTVQLPRGVTAEGMADWRALVGLPGRIVTEPLRLSRPGVVTIGVGDVGTLRITSEGAATELKLQVTEFRDGEPRGPTGHAKTTRGRADMPVAAGDLQYRVAGYGRWGDGSFVVGPRNQGDVVDLHLDLRTCRVVGQIVGSTGRFADPLFAILFGSDEPVDCRADLQHEGSFSVDLPRKHVESVVFVHGGSSGVCPPITLDAAERDVGQITMTARPRLGRIEVRDPTGALLTRPPAIAYLTTAAGKQVRAGFGIQSFVKWVASPDGLDCFAIPGITEVVVPSAFNDMVWEPRVVVIRDGGVFHANLVAGGRVVVLLSAPGKAGLPEMWLEEVATKGRIVRRMARFQDRKAGLQWHEFIGVPSGRFQVCAKGIEIVGGSLEVLAGSDQEITVSMRPQ